MNYDVEKQREICKRCMEGPHKRCVSCPPPTPEMVEETVKIFKKILSERYKELRGW